MFRSLLLAAIAIAVLAFAIEGGEYSTMDLWRQRVRRERLQAQIDSLTRVVDSLRRYEHQVETDPVLQERLAREEFGLVKNGEILYRFAEPAPSDSGADSAGANGRATGRP